MPEKTVLKWDTIERKDAGDLKIFKVSQVRRRNSQLGKEGTFVVLNSSAWVNIIPLTEDNKVIMIEQYRQGIDELTLEVPGGIVEAGEEPKDAGERECKEETGYAGPGNAILLGVNQPNPAFLDNLCYSYVWFDCRKLYEQKLDRHEDIRVIEIPLKDIKSMILEGRINHSLVMDAFFYFFLRYDI